MTKSKGKRNADPNEDYDRFRELAKNLISVSNAEVREKMAEEKRKKSKKERPAK